MAGSPGRRRLPVFRNPKLLRWWYIAIGIGFVLLGIRAALTGERPWLVGLRFLIAAGFLVLAAALKPTVR